MSFPFERLDRDRGPIKGNVFVVTPYGKREFTNDDGEIIAFDFDEQYQDHYVPVIESVGMTPVRADSLYSDETIIGNVWCGIQEADIIIIDLTGSNRNVMVEFAWAYILGKKLIPLTQCRADMPTDLPGLRYIHYSPLVKDQARAEGELAKQLKVLAAEAGRRAPAGSSRDQHDPPRHRSRGQHGPRARGRRGREGPVRRARHRRRRVGPDHR